MIDEIDFDGSPFGRNRLDGDGKDQVDDLERGPKDLTFDSEMEEFTNGELNFCLIFLLGYFGFKVILFSQLDSIISSEKKDNVIHEFINNLLLKGTIVD